MQNHHGIPRIPDKQWREFDAIKGIKVKKMYTQARKTLICKEPENIVESDVGKPSNDNTGI